MKTSTKKPVKKPSNRRPPNPPRKVVAAAAPDNGPRKAYIFQSHMDGVPAIVSISAVTQSPREAIGAAFLAADDFCTWAIKRLKP